MDKEYRLKMYELYSKLRDNCNFIDADVAKATGIAPSTFSDWKAGRSAPKVEKLIRIADLLKVSLKELVP